MINVLLWIFGVMSAMGLGCTVLFNKQWRQATNNRPELQRSPHSSLAVQTPPVDSAKIDTLRRRVRLMLLMTSFDVLAFFGLLVAKMMGIE